MDASPPSSPIPESPQSSPLPPPSPSSSPLRESPPKKARKGWQVFPMDNTGQRQPSRSSLFKWNQIISETPGTSSFQPDVSHEEMNRSEEASHCLDDTTVLQQNNDILYSSATTSCNECFLPPHTEEVHSLPTHVEDNSFSSSASSSGSDMPGSDLSVASEIVSDLGSSADYSSEIETVHSEHSDRQECCNESESSIGSDGEDFDADVSSAIPLYEGCHQTVDEAVLDFLQNYFIHMVSQKCLEDNLKMFNKYLPKPNNMPKTLHKLFKYVKDLAPFYKETEHFYCSTCYSPISFEQDHQHTCTHNCDRLPYGKFYSFSIEEQLRFHFETCRIFELFKPANFGDENIRDICDGSEFKRVCLDGGEYGVTLMLNTDGVSLSNSSHTSLYPLQYVICELPPKVRHLYMIVCGVWCSNTKPPMNMFLKPLVESLLLLFNSGGFTWKHPDTGLLMKSAVKAPLVCADAPVRSQLQNIKAHNGKYACNTCEQKSDKIRLTAEETNLMGQGKRVKRKRAFLFHEDPAQLRTSRRMLKQASKAIEKGHSVKGVKGPTVLSLLPYIDIATCVFGEYLHLVCLGVVKHFLVLWLDVPGPWNVKNKLDDIDEFLNGVAPPSFVGRLPRGLKDVKNWKASEYRAWLLYYSLPALKEILPHIYFQHWSLLVVSIYILLKEEITPDEIKMCETMLRIFLRDVSKLYRQRDHVYNMHELLHLPLYVKRWGPLWATSAFMFESYNGVLAKLIHGSQKKDKELVNKLIIAHGVQILRHKVQLQNSSENSSNPIFQLLSQCDSTSLSIAERQYIFQSGFTKPVLSIFMRMRDTSKREIFTSNLYVREKKRNNYTVMFDPDEPNSISCKYGEIRAFIQDSKNIFCLINTFKTKHRRIFFHEASHARVSHIIPIENSTNLTLLPCNKIIGKVVRVGDFVCKSPNSIEKQSL